MPVGVVKTKKDEQIWKYVKKKVAKQTNKKISQFTSLEWRRVMFLFQKAKKKYKGKLPKRYTASFKSRVLSAYSLKPLEHFKESGILPIWSIQTEQTHGKVGIIRVSRSQLEDPNMAIRTRSDYLRMAGAEDIFQGSKTDLLNYIKNSYKNFKYIEFLKN